MPMDNIFVFFSSFWEVEKRTVMAFSKARGK